MRVYEKIPSLLFECTISAFKENQLVLPRSILRTYGFKEEEICESFQDNHWSLKVYSEDKKLIDHLRLNLPKSSGIKVSSKALKPDQWLTRWKNHWKPLSFTKKIDVIPAWYKDRYKTSKKVIYLDTLMSFGTGMHETTQLIAQLIENNASRLSSFLDIGTGTGILAIAALKLGAQDVTAMDVSSLSVEATRDNLKVNGLKAKVVLSDIGKFSIKKKYEMVAANLITDDLLKYKRKIFQLVAPGGLLMVSGISLDNLKRLKVGFSQLPIICRKTKKGKQWATILYEKKMS